MRLRREIHTSHPPATVVARMKSIIREPASLKTRLMTDEFYDERRRARLEGESRADGFDVECLAAFEQHPGRPRVSGRYHADRRGGTRVELKIGIGAGPLMFAIVWVALLGGVLIAYLAGWFDATPLSMFGVAVLLIAGPAIVVGGFYQEATEAERLIHETVS
jgi:hypothetical protein